MGGTRVIAAAACVASLLLQAVIIFSALGLANAQTGLPAAQAALSPSFYSNTCPFVTKIVDQVIRTAIRKDRNVVGGLVRLFFHDCFVRGCDASLLIDSAPPQVAEKDGIGNKNSLRGFEVIDDIKKALERSCPGIVSCADILSLAARSAIFQIGGPSWRLALGRRDGNVSNAGETVFNLPPPFAKYPQLLDMFAAKGLTEKDMVVLSGAHTIGDTHCAVIEERLYNSTGPGGVDPNMTASYTAQLRATCPFSNGKNFKAVPMDPSLGNNVFDSSYFRNVRANKGIFISDHALLENSNGGRLVKSYSFGQYPFFSDFAASMTKMSLVDVTAAPLGQIRRNCRVVNPAPPKILPSVSAPPPPSKKVSPPPPPPSKNSVSTSQ